MAFGEICRKSSKKGKICWDDPQVNISGRYLGLLYISVLKSLVDAFFPYLAKATNQLFLSAR